MSICDIYNSRYNYFTELLMLELVQKIFRMYSNMKISKICIFVLDGRCLEEEEAEVMEVFPHIEYLFWMADV